MSTKSNYSKSIKKYTAAFLFLFITFFLPFLISTNVSAAAGTLTISIPDTISLDILPSASGTFASTSSNITVRTTYAHGYTLGIAASTANSNALVNTSSSSKTIPSITSAISESTFSSSSSYNNKWGYSPSKYNSSANTNYLVAPTSTTIATLDKTTVANSTDNSYAIKLGTRIDSTLAPGTYENTFVFTVTANATPYSITYVANTSDTVTSMPSPNPQTGETFATSVNISNTIPARDGYVFKGWCSTQTADDAPCTGTRYNPNGEGTDLSWSIDQTATTNTLNLYAMWERACLPVSGNMQDFDEHNDYCTTSGTLTDQRDGSTYTVSNINGRWWMTQNLRITGTISAAGSNFEGESFNVSTADLTAGDSYTEPRSHYDDDTTYGAYYNYCAASAGTVCNDTEQKTATSDICPAGWQLPPYEGMVINNRVSAGYYSGGTLTSAGSAGYWWSSTSYNATSQRAVVSSSISSSNNKQIGSSIRCVKYTPSIVTFSFGSDISSVTVNGTIIDTSGTSIVLDEGLTYTITGEVSDSSVSSFGSLNIVAGNSTAEGTKLKVGTGSSTVQISAKLFPTYTFNFDSHIQKIVINGTTLDSSGSTAVLPPNSTFDVFAYPESGYVPNTMTTTSGSANYGKLTTSSSDGTVSITSQVATGNFNVVINYSSSSSSHLIIDGVDYGTTGTTMNWASGSSHTLRVEASQSGGGDLIDGSITSGNWYVLEGGGSCSSFPPLNGCNSMTLIVGTSDGEIKASSNTGSGCVTADTAITLSNGDKKPVKELTGDEELLVWDFNTGSYSVAPIVFIEPEKVDDYNIIHLYFSDGTDVETFYEHGFFDYTKGKYIYINEDNPERFIGDEFIKQDGDTYKTVTLTDVKHEIKHTTVYGLTTYKHFNFFNNDMLSIEGNITGMFNYFDVDKETMAYDPIKKQADIKKYGLLTYEDFNGMIDELGFEAYNGQYLAVSIGKGLTTWEGIKKLADYYGHFTAEADEEAQNRLNGLSSSHAVLSNPAPAFSKPTFENK